jgi:uncharacterized protein YdaU (DUF1376 family)
MNPPKMPIHIGDLLRDTGHLSAAGVGAYLLLLFHHWSTGSLPNDDEQLARIARQSKAEWARLRPVIAKFFEEGWRHGRVEEDLEKAHASYQKRATAGEKGGKAKAKLKQSSSNATADPEQCSSYHLPLTKVPKVDTCRKRGIAFAEILAGLERYIRTKPPDRAWLNPETFLNQERWTDQPAPQGNSNGETGNGGERLGFSGLAAQLRQRIAEREAAGAAAGKPDAEDPFPLG